MKAVSALFQLSGAWTASFLTECSMGRKRKQARPTEYKGVVYRSKSEAMCAKLLEHEFQVVEYEPRRFAVGDWIPDFFASRMARAIEYEPCCRTCGKAHEMAFSEFNCEECGANVDFRSPLQTATSLMIEYKPALPTETYIAECFKRFFSIHKWLLRDRGELAYAVSYEIRFGSPYSKSEDVGFVNMTCYSSDGLSPIVIYNDWIGDIHREEVLNYRFDLVEAT
jgi:hypothetical protein